MLPLKLALSYVLRHALCEDYYLLHFSAETRPRLKGLPAYEDL